MISLYLYYIIRCNNVKCETCDFASYNSTLLPSVIPSYQPPFNNLKDCTLIK